MKRTLILLSLLGIAAASCTPAEDTRYIAPEVAFENGTYTVESGSGGLDATVLLSRPAPQAFSAGLIVSSSMQEGLQYSLGSSSIQVPAGAEKASVHIELKDDEIWDESSWIDLTLAPGERYTINPDGNCSAHIDVTKVITLPILKLSSASASIETNPFLPESFCFSILVAKNSVSAATPVTVSLGSLVCGKDYLINGGSEPVVTLPAGAQRTEFDLQMLFRDESGLDITEMLALVPVKGSYMTVSGEAEFPLHICDPAVDFRPIFKTSAMQSGEGYQMRQAFKAPDGSWTESQTISTGTNTVDLGQTAEGSNYLRNFRNMFDHPSFGCRANAANSQWLRMSELFPGYVYPNPVAILDYGNDQGHRQFSPADSLMRFVLDKGETSKGRIYLLEPKTFTAFIGSYAEWQKDIAGGKTWVVDSKATGGDIFASANPAITGSISVTLHRLEGYFDFSNKTEPIVLSAWMSSDSDMFLQGIDDSKIAVAQDGGLYRIDYRIWPR